MTTRTTATEHWDATPVAGEENTWRVAPARELLREALEALDFYANKDNHKLRRASYRDRFSQNMKPGRPKLGRVSEDKGKRARATADKIRAALGEEQS